MLQFIGVHHQFGPSILFQDFSWHIKPGQKVGLIGPNGSGKTTLFQFAMGTMQPDKGTIVRSKKTEISLFQQIPNFNPDNSVLDTVILSNYRYQNYLSKKSNIEKKLNELKPEHPDYDSFLHEQAELEDYAYTYDLHNLEVRSKKILTGLGFGSDDFERTISNFSPGYHHRLGLAIALLNPHNLLLLDEPTNHLDDASKTWLAEHLNNTKDTFVLVTHDPEFLNETIDTLAEISMKGVTEFKGSLDAFLEEKNEIHEKMLIKFQKEEAFLKKRTDWINRFRAKATKARQVQSQVKRLEKREKVENPEDIFWNKTPDYRFNFLPSGKMILKLESGKFQYKDNPIFADANLDISLGDKIALVGPNGAGKSTLLKCIYGILSLTNGKIDYGTKTKMSYFSQTHTDTLNLSLNLIQTVLQKYPNIREAEIRSLLGHFSFSGDSVFKNVSLMSGGEQSRLRLSMLVLEPVNFLLLDEPTNHLDLVTRNALKLAIHKFEGTALIISHDPDFLSELCNKTYLLSDGKLQDLNCSFSEYQNLYTETNDKKQIKTKNIDTRSSQNPDKKRLKRMEKDILVLEDKIHKLENEKTEIEKSLSDPNFYKNPSHISILEEYPKLKNELADTMDQWEKVNLDYETLSNELSI